MSYARHGGVPHIFESFSRFVACFEARMYVMIAPLSIAPATPVEIHFALPNFDEPTSVQPLPCTVGCSGPIGPEGSTSSTCCLFLLNGSSSSPRRCCCTVCVVVVGADASPAPSSVRSG